MDPILKLERRFKELEASRAKVVEKIQQIRPVLRELSTLVVSDRSREAIASLDKKLSRY